MRRRHASTLEDLRLTIDCLPLRTRVAMLAGVLLALLTVAKVLDMGFYEALRRPFDPVVDWRYVGSFVSLVHDSFGETTGNVLLVALALLAVGLNLWMMKQFSMDRMSLLYVLVGIVSLLVLGQGAVFAPALRASRVSPVEATRSV